MDVLALLILKGSRVFLFISMGGIQGSEKSTTRAKHEASERAAAVSASQINRAKPPAVQ